MRPVSLTLRGFIGIKRGMGLDEVTLDLSGLTGLIAFDGPVGRGKSTILDNLHPFRRLASREKALQHHVFLRDSRKEYVFDLDGHRYRTLLKIDSQSGRQEGFIWKDGESQVSGKTTEYDQYIENLMGSSKLFFQSAFAAQGGKSLADMTEGDLKKLFTEFLPLEKLVKYEESAKQAGNAVQDQIDEINRRIAAAQNQVADKQSLESELSCTASRIKAAEVQSRKIQSAIDTISSELEKARNAAAGHRSAVQREQELAKEKAEAKKQITEIDSRWDRYKKSIDEKISAAKTAISEKRTALQGRSQLQTMKNELQLLDAELPEKEREQAQGRSKADVAQDDIEEKTRALNEYIAKAGKSVDDQQARIDELSEKAHTAERRGTEIAREIQSMEKDEELTRLSYRIKELETTAAKKDMLPEECNPDICPFIADVRRAEAELPKVRVQHKELQAAIKYRLDQLRAEQQQNKADIEESRKAYQQAVSRKKQLSAELENGKKSINAQVASRVKIRDEAKAHVARAQKEITRIKQRQAQFRSSIENQPNYETLEAEIKSYENRISELTDDLAQKQKDYDRLMASTKTRLSEIDSAVAALPLDPKAEALVKTKLSELDAARKSAKTVADDLAKMKSDLAVLRHRLQQCAMIEERIAADQQTVSALRKELSEWRYIQIACGKDGLRALEIDGTAPMIAAYANSLLTITGSDMTVGFRTLDDDGKECLEVIVYRGDDEDDRGTTIKNLSGGQKVWVLKALRLALTLVAKEKSGRDIAAALTDEEDGSLDAESAVSFIGLYRAFMKTGGFLLCLYITHRDTCKQMADHVVRFTQAGIVVDFNNFAAQKAA